MALSVILCQELCARLKPGDRIASWGYPDIIAPPKEIERILGAKIYGLKYRDDSAAIGKWHGVEHRIPDAYSFFAAQGATLDVYDVAQHRGGEIIADLNEPLAIVTEYDVVIDVGTIEHAFNIGTAFVNMASMLKRGGVILHENPHNWGNHGFYGIQPTLYADFYGQSGFTLHECWLCPRGKDPIKDIERKRRFSYSGPEANMIAIAERTEILPIQFPVQGKYKSMISAAVAAPAAGVPGAPERETANG
jgi:hypothetical protein